MGLVKEYRVPSRRNAFSDSLNWSVDKVGGAGSEGLGGAEGGL